MKRILVLLGIFLVASCSSQFNVKPDAELQKMSSRKILNLAAANYVNYQYDAAIHYYKKLVEFFPDDLENVAWAKYEIGFIYYKKGQYKKADKYFNEVSAQDSKLLVGAQILSSKMKDVIAQKLHKKKDLSKKTETNM